MNILRFVHINDLIDVLNPDSKTIDTLMRLNLPAGVDIEISICSVRFNGRKLVGRHRYYKLLLIGMMQSYADGG